MNAVWAAAFGLNHAPVYSNLPGVATGQITVISLNESNLVVRNSVGLWKRSASWLCLSLMFWTVAAESTHIHPSQSGAAACSICVVAHTANPTPHSIDTTPFFTAVDLFHEEDVAAKARFDFSDLDIRGPPVAL
jgi:hypothetical protein